MFCVLFLGLDDILLCFALFRWKGKTIWNIRFETSCPPYFWHVCEIFPLSSIWLLLCPVMINKCSRVTFLLKWNDEEFRQFCCHWYISKLVVFLNIQQYLFWAIRVFCRTMPCLTFIYMSMRVRDIFYFKWSFTIAWLLKNTHLYNYTIAIHEILWS